MDDSILRLRDEYATIKSWDKKMLVYTKEGTDTAGKKAKYLFTRKGVKKSQDR